MTDFSRNDDRETAHPQSALNGVDAHVFEEKVRSQEQELEDGPRLDAVLVEQLDRYFARLDGQEPHPLYDLVIRAVERPLLEYAMSMCNDSQLAAAKLLGINRNTLRKKLREHGLIDGGASFQRK